MSERFSDPRQNVLQLGLHEGMVVGDFGAGSGHYTRALAAAVAPVGKVYAVDVQEDVLKHLKSGTNDTHQHIVETVWGDIERPGGTHLQDQSLDAIVLANALFQVENRSATVTEIKRTLRHGGKLLLVDWAGSYGGIGPAASRVVSEHDAEGLFIGAGFHKMKSFRAGPHHYGIVFSSP